MKLLHGFLTGFGSVVIAVVVWSTTESYLLSIGVYAICWILAFFDAQGRTIF